MGSPLLYHLMVLGVSIKGQVQRMGLEERVKEYNSIVFSLRPYIRKIRDAYEKPMHSTIQFIRARSLETKLIMTKGVITSEYLIYKLPHDPAVVEKGWSRIQQYMCQANVASFPHEHKFDLVGMVCRSQLTCIRSLLLLQQITQTVAYNNKNVLAYSSVPQHTKPRLLLGNYFLTEGSKGKAISCLLTKFSFLKL